MTNSECLDAFKKYLLEVKKSSQNTLSSYMRDVRQLAYKAGGAFETVRSFDLMNIS